MKIKNIKIEVIAEDTNQEKYTTNIVFTNAHFQVPNVFFKQLEEFLLTQLKKK